MCGRYVFLDVNNLDEHFLRDSKKTNKQLKLKLKPNYNVAPTQTMPVITETNGMRQLELMQWGIPRMVGKDIRKSIINTRSDKAFSPFWRKTVQNKRCLIPANGFYEWKTSSTGKQPFYIKPKDPNSSLFAFAGIFDEWTDNDGKTIKTYSIMTTEPNKEMSDIHNRMPVILHEEDEESWLAGVSDESLLRLLTPLENGSLTFKIVSTAVNNVKNNTPELIAS